MEEKEKKENEPKFPKGCFNCRHSIDGVLCARVKDEDGCAVGERVFGGEMCEWEED